MYKESFNIFTRSVIIGTLLASGCSPLIPGEGKESHARITAAPPTSTIVPIPFPPTPTETEIPLINPKIMILGDSITEYGFGERLETAIEKEGIKGEFIIEERGGYTTKMILKALRDGKINLEGRVPDILLIQLGINDVLRRKYNNTEITGFMKDIILFFRDKNPDIRIILFPIIPSSFQGQEWEAIGELNQNFTLLAEALNTPDSPVITSPDISPYFDKKKDLADDIHPTNSGYDKMIASAISSIDRLLHP